MKKLTLLTAIITISIQLSGQDMFPVKQLTFDPAQQGFATWSPDSKYLGLYIMPTEGGRSLPLVVTKDGHTEGAAWSPDGKKIAYTRTNVQNFDIWVMDVDIKKIWRILQKEREN